MKNKKMIWILGPSVLIIWGLIIFRVVNAVKGDDQPMVLAHPVPEMEVSEVQDTSTYTLNLEYKDPFLKNSRPYYKTPVAPTSNKPKTTSMPKVVKTVKKLPLNWPTIQYMGLVGGQHQRLYLMQVNGSSVFMSEGEINNDLKITNAYSDSVIVEFKGEEKRTFKKQ